MTGEVEPVAVGSERLNSTAGVRNTKVNSSSRSGSDLRLTQRESGRRLLKQEEDEAEENVHYHERRRHSDTPVRRHSTRSREYEEDDRIATELPELPDDTHHEHDVQHEDIDNDEWEGMRRYSDVTTAENSADMRRYRLARQTPKWHGGIVKWWQRQISVKVDVKGRRDHLALERTFLGYIRTSLAFSMLGVLITQLFRLQHTYFPDETFGFYVVGIPLGTIFIFAAIVIVLIGAFRFWRQQSAMGRGKVWAGGWEINTIMVGSILVSTGLFAVFLRF